MNVCIFLNKCSTVMCLAHAAKQRRKRRRRRRRQEEEGKEEEEKKKSVADVLVSLLRHSVKK